MKNTLYIYLTMLVLAGLLNACRKGVEPAPEETETLFTPNPNASVKGVYVLNEGNLNMNKASLDYIDYTTGVYRRNIYSQLNPEVTKGLGDVGNDMAVYGSKLYIVVNNSNKVEVLNAKTGKRIKQIDMVNGRYITFYQNKAYVSAYLGSVGNAANGIVAQIDTTSLLVERQVTVGRQPEEIAVIGHKLYIANSGGYSPPNYERTVSVVDLASFTEIKRIDVAINLEHIKADSYGDLYITSRGDYLSVPAKMYVLDTQTDQIKKIFDLQARTLYISGNLAYVINAATGSQAKYNYNLIDVQNETLLDRQFVTTGLAAQIINPYGLSVNPTTQEVLLTDAKDYVTPGTLYGVDAQGNKKWQVTTGDVPAHFAFIY